MNTNRNKMGGVGIYLVVIAVIAVLYFAPVSYTHLTLPTTPYV